MEKPTIIYDKNEEIITIRGTIDADDGDLLEYYAANPPTRTYSYSGTNLPYPNSNVAYCDTKNNGKTLIKNNKYEFTIKYPNAFYAGLGTKYIEPHVIIRVLLKNGLVSQPIFLKLNNGFPYKTLTYSPPPNTWPRNSPLFYYGKDDLPIRSQEQILRDSAYPKENKYPDNFWGLKPMQ